LRVWFRLFNACAACWPTVDATNVADCNLRHSGWLWLDNRRIRSKNLASFRATFDGFNGFLLKRYSLGLVNQGRLQRVRPRLNLSLSASCKLRADGLADVAVLSVAQESAQFFGRTACQRCCVDDRGLHWCGSGRRNQWLNSGRNRRSA